MTDQLANHGAAAQAPQPAPAIATAREAEPAPAAATAAKSTRSWSWPKIGGKVWTLLESAFVAAVVSAVVSGAVLVWGTARIETSKEELANLVRQKSALDSAQTAVFSQLNLYTGRVFEQSDNSSKEQLQSAIVTAQLQVARLLNEVPKDKREPLLEYSKELESLSKSLRSVKTKYDLGPLYASAQKLLALHDEVSEQLHKDMEVSVWRRKS